MTTLHLKYKTLLQTYGINTPLRLAHFFAQLDHESGLRPISENLNYSAQRLCRIFPKDEHFPTIEIAKLYEKKPALIGSRIYANRMGNGSEQSGDGYRYRGRGFIQITGKENYLKLSQYTGINFVVNPDLLLSEDNSMVAALWYWKKINANKYADKDDIKTITKLINGGYNGLHHRRELLIKYKAYFV